MSALEVIALTLVISTFIGGGICSDDGATRIALGALTGLLLGAAGICVTLGCVRLAQLLGLT